MCRSKNSPPPPTMPSHHTDKIMRPRLPRNLAASARINLNRYWHALEELMPVSSRRPFDEADANAVNDNIDNERRLAEMRLAEAEQERNRLGGGFKASSQNNYADSCSSFPITPSCCIDSPMTPDENTPPPSTPGASR